MASAEAPGGSSRSYISFTGFKGTTTVPILSGSEKKPTFTSIPIEDCSKYLSDSLHDRQDIAQDVRPAFIEANVFYAVT
jgi:hypothetical protein